MITTLVRRVLPVAGLALLLGALVRAQSRPPVGSDGYFHLRMGHEFLAGWSLHHPANLSPFDTAHWLPTQWLSQIAMAALEDQAGLVAVMWAVSVLVLVLALAVYVSCRLSAAPLPAALATVLACGAASPGLSARPQLLSYLFVVVATAGWLATLRDGRPRWWLIALAWAWAPVHGTWPVAIFIAVAALAGLALERRYSLRHLAVLGLVPLFSVVSVLATPLGTDIYRSLFAVGTRSEFFAEWGPADLTTPYAIALLAMFAIVLLTAVKRTSLPWGQLLLVGLAAVFAVSSVRTTTLAALMLAPLVANALQEFVPHAPRLQRREGGALAALLIVFAVILVPVASGHADDTVVPRWLDARLDAQPAETRILNDWNSGAYFLWRHPHLSLVMHGYGDVFTNDELTRNLDILRLRPGWDDQVEDLDVDLALVDPDTPLGYALTNDLGWSLVESDDDFALLAPPTGG